MTLATFLVVAAVILLIAVVGLLIHLSSHGDLPALQAKLVAIDVNAFRNLLDPSEEIFLRQSLTASEFRQVHRLRMLAAIEYVWFAARNAGILIRIADAVRTDVAPSTDSTASSLIENATQLRLYAATALPRFALSMAIPGWVPAGMRVPEMYESISRQMIVLGCLQLPAR
jgi:hypothetical protein